MEVVIFLRPDGRRKIIDLHNIAKDDEAWFMNNGVVVSMEEGLRHDHYIIYADIGRKSTDGEPDEIILFSKGRKCEDCMAELRVICEGALKEKDQWPTS